MMTAVSLEQRQIDLRVAQNNLGYTASLWLQAKAAGVHSKARRLGRELDNLQQECRRAERRLTATRKRLQKGGG